MQSWQSLMSRFGVQGFPTILVFGLDKSNPYPYEGPRTASAIEAFGLEQLEVNLGPAEVFELTGPVSVIVINLSSWSHFSILVSIQPVLYCRR